MQNLLIKYKQYNYILKALGILLIITLISYIFRSSLAIINITLIHIIPVIVVAIHGNIKATLFITLLSVILLSFLYIPPLYSFSVHNELYVWSFFIFGIVGWIITIQAKNLNTQTKQNEIRESLLHIISHDLRTPLSTIHGSINLILSNDNLDEKSKYNLYEDINYASHRMKRLITNILDSTRLSSGKIDLKLEWCDFEDIVVVNTHCIYEVSTDIDVKLMVNEAEKLSYISLAIDTGNMPSFSGIERFIDQFFRCCKISGLSFMWLQKLYIGKNCLNQFRQDNGYKEGHYIKVWNGNEDNVVMVELLGKMDDVSFDDLYSKLKEEYNKNR
jgi:K+-sensing histidine kinase KdpD